MESRGVAVVADEYSDHHQQQQHLSMAMPININNIPVGFRFSPSDIELIECYLKKRMMISASSSSSLPEADGLIVDFDVYSCNPWELPHHLFRYPSQQREMYFFSPTRPLSTSSSSSNKRCGRTTGCGVWHGNGQDNRIVKKGVVIGHTTAFKFEMMDQTVAGAGAENAIKGSNKRSNGNGNGRRKTDWLMHEYRLPSTNALVLCKIYENKTREAAAASSSRKQQEHQQHHLLNTKRRRTVEEEEEPVSVRPHAAMPMPSLVSIAYSNAPALDHMIQVPELMQQPQQLLLNTKRRRVIEEEEPVPVPVPLAAVLPRSSEITLMASAPVPVPAEQQQQQQVEDAYSDFAFSFEQLLEEETEREMSCGVAAAVPVLAVMPDARQNMPELPSLQQKGCGSASLTPTSTLAADKEFSANVAAAAAGVAVVVPVPAVMPDEWQNMPELPSLQQKGCGSAPLIPTSTLAADKEFSADVAAAAAAAVAVSVPAVMPDEWQNMPELPSLQQKSCGSVPLTPTSTLAADKEFSADVAAAAGFEQEGTESDERPLPLLKRSQVDETANEQLQQQQQQQQQEQGLVNTLDSTEAASGTTGGEDMESLLKNLSFDHELGSLPPLDFLTLTEHELSMTADEFFEGVEDYPF